VTLNGGTRQALDRGLEDNTAGQRQWRWPATARHNVAVQVFSDSEHLAPTPQQKFSTAGAGGSSPQAQHQQSAGLISAEYLV